MTTVLRPAGGPARVRTAEPARPATDPGRNPAPAYDPGPAGDTARDLAGETDHARDVGRDTGPAQDLGREAGPVRDATHGTGTADRRAGDQPAWHLHDLRPRDAHLTTLLADLRIHLNPDGTAETRLASGDPLPGTWHAHDSAILLTTTTGERSLDGYLTPAGTSWRLDAVHTGPGRPGMTIAHLTAHLATEPPADPAVAGPGVTLAGDGVAAEAGPTDGPTADQPVPTRTGCDGGVGPAAGGRTARPIATPYAASGGDAAAPAPDDIAGPYESEAVRELRRRLARPSLAGRWHAPAGPLRDVTVTAPPGTTFVRLPRRTGAEGEAVGFLRLAWELDLATGLVAGPDGWEPVVLTRRDRPDLSAFGPADASALRRLGLDLVAGRRYGEAAPLLDRAAALYAAAPTAPASIARGTAAIDRLGLAGARLFCAFAQRAFHRLPDLLVAVADVRRGATIGPESFSAWRDAVTFLTGTATDVHGTLRLLADAAAAAPACPPELRDASAAAAADAEALLAALRAADTSATDPEAVEIAAHVLAIALAETERSLRATADRLAGPEPPHPARGPAGEHVVAEPGAHGGGPRPPADPAAPPPGPGEPPRPAPGPRTGDIASAGTGETAAPATRDSAARPSGEAAGSAGDGGEAVPSPRDTVIMTVRDSADLVAVLRNHLARSDPARAARQVRAEAAAAARVSARYVETWRALLDSHWDKIHSTDLALPFYERMVTLLLDIDAPEDALVASEMSRARAFADALRESRAGPYPSALTVAPPLSRAALRAILAGHDAVVVEYFLAGDLLAVWVCPRGGEVTPVVRRIDRAALSADVAEFNRLARLTMHTPATRAEMADVLRRLGAALWDVIPPGLLPGDPDEPVTVIPHQELFQVPFAALRDEHGGYLVHRHAIRVLPALALVPDLAAAAADTPAGPETLVALVNPEPMPEERPLRLLEANFADIAELYGEHVRHVATRGAANLATLRRVAAEGTVLFFGTHARAVAGASRDPLTSYLLLAPSPGHDGYLRARDVPGLGVRARLVILAACETGGGEVTADGVIGLSRAFLTSGPNALITTLYPVGERASLEVMTAFHEEWLLDGHAPVSALRRAMALVAGWQSPAAPEPHVWAAFTYFGLGVPARAGAASAASTTHEAAETTAGRTVA